MLIFQFIFTEKLLETQLYQLNLIVLVLFHPANHSGEVWSHVEEATRQSVC